MPCALYVHVPFCRSRCAYCGFYSGEPLALLGDYPAWVEAEAHLRGEGFPSPKALTSIYLGGGTPALLGAGGISTVLEAARRVWGVSGSAEVTVETNPGEAADFGAWRGVGVNRLSVGVQALDNRVLGVLGRCHSADEARRTLAEAVRAGIPQVSADLLYGVPTLQPEALGKWVRELSVLGVSHISAYSLELHSGTPLAEAVAAGRVPACGAEEEERQWEAIAEALSVEGYDAYEVSNFARPGSHSRHNCAYWDGSPYLGLGPGAHGYSPSAGPWGTRWWNEPGLGAYRDSVLAGKCPPGGREALSREAALLETLFLSLRRAAPRALGVLATRFGLPPAREREMVARLENAGLVGRSGPESPESWIPTPGALRRADGLALWARDLLLSDSGGETAA